MKFFVGIFLLVASVVGVVYSSKPDIDCESTQFLFINNIVPADEIYKHICVIKNGGVEQSNFLGIYRIGKKWWCDSEKPGGSCNLKCSNLLDNNYADDAKCAKLIMDTHGGVGAWNLNDDDCKSNYDYLSKLCLYALTNYTTEQTEIMTNQASKPNFNHLLNIFVVLAVFAVKI